MDDGILHPLTGDVGFCLQQTLFGGKRCQSMNGALQLLKVAAKFAGLGGIADSPVLGGLLLRCQRGGIMDFHRTEEGELLKHLFLLLRQSRESKPLHGDFSHLHSQPLLQ